MSSSKKILRSETTTILSLVPFTFNKVELQVVTIDSKEWWRVKEICKDLKYQRQTAKVIKDHCSGENSAYRYQLSKFPAAEISVNWPKDSQKYNLYINEEGLRELVLTSQQPQAGLLAEKLGINVHKRKYMSKENSSIEIILGTFDGEEMIRQFHIGKYHIDLYFPERISWV